MKPQLNLTSQHIYTFSAAQGFQYKPYFNINVPARVLIKLLRIDDSGSTMERSQRTVNEKRANDFADYLIDNLMSNTPFIIPTVTGFIDSTYAEGEASFISALEQCDLDNANRGFGTVGLLCVGMDSEFKLFDGQHRSRGTAIGLERIAKNPERYSKIDLSTLSVPVMAYLDLTLEERQTFFSDINMNMAKPQAAIGISYDHRDPLARFAVEIAQELPFKGLVELERNTIGKKSDKLFSLKTIFDVVKTILGLGNKYTKEDLTEERKQYVRDVLNKFSRPMGWSALEFSGNADDIRDHSIITHTVMLKAVAEAANVISDQFPNFEGAKLSNLSKLNYGRNDGDFMNRCIDPQSKTMRMNSTGIKLAANKLIMTVGAKLDPVLNQLERQYFPNTEVQSQEAQKPDDVEPTTNRNNVFKADARSIVLLAAGSTVREPNLVTRKVGLVLKSLVSFEEKRDLSLVPYVDTIKDEVNKLNDTQGDEASWKLLASVANFTKLIESVVNQVGYSK